MRDALLEDGVEVKGLEEEEEEEVVVVAAAAAAEEEEEEENEEVVPPLLSSAELLREGAGDGPGDSATAIKPGSLAGRSNFRASVASNRKPM